MSTMTKAEYRAFLTEHGVKTTSKTTLAELRDLYNAARYNSEQAEEAKADFEPVSEGEPDATYAARGNYNSVFSPLAEVLAEGNDDVRVWTERQTTMLWAVQIAGPGSEPFLRLLEEVVSGSLAALRDWQREHAEERRDVTDMERFNQNRSFVAGYGAAVAAELAGTRKLPEVAFARDMEKAVRPSPLKAGAAAGKASGIGQEG